MSSNGAMVETSLPPTRGTYVYLMRGSLVARGTVIWSSANRCGLKFSSEVSVKDWLAAPTAVHQNRVDEMVALVQAGQAAVATDHSVEQGFASENRSHGQLVEDLGAVISLIQNLGDDLASSDETLARHGIKLQNLDIAMQMLRAVSAELTPNNSTKLADLAKLKDIQVACAKALATDAMSLASKL